MLINSLTKNDVNELGDIVGTYTDSHIFDANELNIFDIVSVLDSDVDNMEIIEEATAIKDIATDEYEFTNDIEVVDTALIEWLWKKKSEGDWKELKTKSKYKHNYDGDIKDKNSEKPENMKKAKIKK